MCSTIKKIFLIFFIIVSYEISYGIEPETVLLNNHVNKKLYSIAPNAVIFEDKTHQISLNKLLDSAEKYNQLFTQLKDDDKNLNFTTSTFWIKFKIKNTDTLSHQFLLETARPVTNIANLYIIYKNGETFIQENGDEIPFAKRDVMHRRLLFDVNIGANEEITCFLKLRSDGEILHVPIILWNPDSLEKKDYKEQLMFGLYYGSLLIVIIIFFFFYLALREHSFLFYVLYVFFIMLLQFSLDGLSFQYLWPNQVWWASHIVPASASLTQFFALLYSKLFLNLKKSLPKIGKIFNLFIGLSLLCLIMSFNNSKLYILVYPVINLLSLISIFLILTTIIIKIINRQSISLFYTIAFTALLFGVIIYVISNINIIAINTYSENSIKFGSAIEVVFLSLAMANKYKEIHQEKELAQAESLRIAKENEFIIMEQNIILEQKVTERTMEVVKQKAIIEQKNKDVLDSIYYARRIQHALLATKGILNRNLNEYFILYKPKDIVSGDFYWAQEINNEFLFAVCDCTGHGVPGAFMSLLNITFLNEVTNEKHITRPDMILNQVRNSIIHALNTEQNEESRDGMDCVICKFDLKNLNVEFACSNNPLWVIRSNELIEFKPDKMPVGNHTDNSKPFTHQSFKLQRGDKIYIFSDGYADQFGGPLGKKFKYSQLQGLLLSINNKPLNEQKEILNETIIAWKGELDQVDDICIIGIKF